MYSSDPEKQLSWLRDCIAKFPQDPTPQLLLGELYAAKNDWHSASACFNCAIDINVQSGRINNSPVILHAMGQNGIAQLKLGRLEDARKSLEQVAQHWPQSAYAVYFTEVNERCLAIQREAEVPFQISAQRYFFFFFFWFFLVFFLCFFSVFFQFGNPVVFLFLFVGNFSKSQAARLEQRRQVIEKLFTDGSRALHARQWVDAAKYFTELTLLVPNDDRSFWGLGTALWRGGDDVNGALCFERAISLNPNSNAVADLKVLRRAQDLKVKEMVRDFERDQLERIRATNLKIAETKQKLGVDVLESDRQKYKQLKQKLAEEKVQLESNLLLGPEYVRVKVMLGAATTNKKAFRFPAHLTSPEVARFVLDQIRARFSIPLQAAMTLVMLDLSDMSQTRMSEADFLQRPCNFRPDIQLIVYSVI
jgi:tetratricopeptide (TPR) repeat protein